MARREADINLERERQIQAGRAAVQREELMRLSDVIAKLEDVDPDADVDDREIRAVLLQTEVA
jgi:hypothetical protein